MDVTFPDPKDRSINSPMVVISLREILTIYNWNELTIKKNTYIENSISKDVKAWFIITAKQYGWKTIGFSGNQIVLSMECIELIT